MPIERLPTKVRPYAYRLKEWLMTDSPPLLILGVMSTVTGVAYIFNPPNPPIHPIEMVTFLGFFGVMWICAGILLLACSYFPKSRVAGYALGAGVGLCYIWGGSLITQSFLEHALGYLARALQYVSVGTLVLYIIWLKSVLVRNEVLPPTAEEVRDVLRGDAS